LRHRHKNNPDTEPDRRQEIFAIPLYVLLFPSDKSNRRKGISPWGIVTHGR
jgi:hypothetical protein